MFMSPTISVCVASRNRPKSLSRLLASIHKHASALIPIEVVISDGSDQPSCEAQGDVRVLRQPPVNGVPRTAIQGFNSAFRAARGEYVAWFNDDCAVTAGWDVAAFEFMSQNSNVGVGAMSWCDMHSDDARHHKCRFMVRSIWGVVYANFGIISRDLGERVGWFDERLTSAYGCDNSLCCRVMDLGLGVVAIAGSKVVHYRVVDVTRQENYRDLQNRGNNFKDLYWENWPHYVDVDRKFRKMQPECLE